MAMLLIFLESLRRRCFHFRNKNVTSILTKFTFRRTFYSKVNWKLDFFPYEETAYWSHIVANATTDQILMGNTCELPWMGSRKYFSGHKSLLRDVSGAIDSLPTCEWRSDIYHLRINIMRVCFSRSSHTDIHVCRKILTKDSRLEPSIGCDKIAASTFPHISLFSKYAERRIDRQKMK